MNKRRFEIRFDEDAWKEYSELDNSRIKIVDKYLERLELHADEMGKNLSNFRSAKLAGCKELKLKKLNIRIVFQITDLFVDILRIVYVLSVEQRSNDIVFRLADKRYKSFKGISRQQLLDFVQTKKKFRESPEKR